MAEFQKKRKWQNALYSKTVLLMLFGLLAVLIVSIVNTVPKTIEAAKNKENVRRQYEELEAQESALKTKIDKLKTAEGIEENVRDKFRVAKEGEGLVVIVDEPEKNPESPPPPPKNFWSFVKSLFK